MGPPCGPHRPQGPLVTWDSTPSLNLLVKYLPQLFASRFCVSPSITQTPPGLLTLSFNPTFCLHGGFSIVNCWLMIANEISQYPFNDSVLNFVGIFTIADSVS